MTGAINNPKRAKKCQHSKAKCHARATTVLYAMQCYYAMLCNAMLCYAMLLCYAMQCYAMQCYAMQCDGKTVFHVMETWD